MIYVDIDVLTPCLIDITTGEVVNTEVVQVRSSVLSKFTKKNGWYTDWNKLACESEVYALMLTGTFSIQGLIAIHKDANTRTAFIDWAVASPENNPLLTKNKKYKGVGGHLFAIAADKSIQYGYNGAISGFAANKVLMEHYIKTFNAEPICQLHPYQIFIDEINGSKLREVYSYEWSDKI